MERRTFLTCAAATATVLAAQGYLPLLAAEKAKKARRGGEGGSGNWFTEPCAIEPITGYLDTFSPVKTGRMAEAFKARYTLVHWKSAAAKSHNAERGSLEAEWQAGQLKTAETRQLNPDHVVRTSVKCAGEWNTVSEWNLNASFAGRNNQNFTETGTWDGKTMTVKAESWTQEYATAHPLIARWSLLPLVASGKIRKSPLVFDMLDDSTLRPTQTLRYVDEITIPIQGGSTKLSSYVHTGNAIVPTHYLVDADGRVQLITMSMISWALTGLSK